MHALPQPSDLGAIDDRTPPSVGGMLCHPNLDGGAADVDHGAPRPQLVALAYWTQNSLPSGSCITTQNSPRSCISCSTDAPASVRRATSAPIALTRSSWSSIPVAALMSRCTRFLTTFPSGTCWKNSRGPTPSGSITALREFHWSSGTSQARSASSHESNPPAGGCSSYPSASPQNVARRCGSAQSITTCTRVAMATMVARNARAAPALRVRRGCGRRDNPTWLIVWRSPRPASLERACCCHGTVRRMHDDVYFDEAVAARYDELERQRFARDEIDAAADLLAELAAGGRALEFAIGTGRIALPLTSRGVDVAGIELSNAMLARLRAKPGADDIAVALGDMTTTTIDGSFSLVYLVYNTIENLASQDAQVACFRNAAAHLAPGGRFVIEVGVPGLRTLPPGQTHVVFHASDGYWGIDEYDVRDQRLISHHVENIDGRYHSVSMPFRYAWPAEFDLMEQLAGMTLRERWGGWRGEPFTADSTQHVSVWQTPF